jgi:ribosomal protein S18 acetylase RimI-like enzyme
MIKYSEAKEEDILGMIQVMRDTGYADLRYGKKSDLEIKKIILASGWTFLICYEENPKLIIGYFIYSSVKECFEEEREFISFDNKYAAHRGIGILKKFRGKKYGRGLTEYGLEKIKESYPGIYADVASDNHISINFHKKLGFETLGEFESSFRKEGVKNIVIVKHFKKK